MALANPWSSADVAIMGRFESVVWLGLCAWLTACGGSPRFIPPERTVYFPIPVDSDANSPLTYVVKANSAVDYSAPFVKGAAVAHKSTADVSELVPAADRLRVAGGLDQVRIASGAEDVTYIIVDARMESVSVVRNIKYNEKSKCCLEGVPTDSCVGGYIESVLVGTGTVTYARLKNKDDDKPSDADNKKNKEKALPSRADLVAVKVRKFENSYFAYRVASAERACEFSQ